MKKELLVAIVMSLFICGGCDSDVKVIRLPGISISHLFSASGELLVANWRKIEDGKYVGRYSNIYQTGTWERVASIKHAGNWDTCISMCSDEVVICREEIDESNASVDLVIIRISDNMELNRFAMAPNWYPRATCMRPGNLTVVDVGPGTIKALDSSSGEVVRVYKAGGMEEEYQGFTKYTPFVVQQQEDRLVWIDLYEAVLWVYRLSTGKLLRRIDMWPYDEKYSLGVSYEFMDNDQLALGVLGGKQEGSGAYIVLADISELAVRGEYYLGPYDLHDTFVMEPGDGTLLVSTHEPSAMCGEIRWLDTTTGESGVGLDLCELGSGDNFGVSRIPERDVFLVLNRPRGGGTGPEESYELYEYPTYSYIKDVFTAIPYYIGVKSVSRGLTAWDSYYNDHIGIFDWDKLDYTTDFHVCKNISQSGQELSVSPEGRWLAVDCEGEELGDPDDGIPEPPVGAGVAVVDLDKYSSHVPECEDRSYLQCGADGSVHWYDSCGNDQGVALECEEAHSTGCENLSAHHAACVCAGNWDPHFGCRVCRGHLDPATDCTECQPHWSDVANDCLTCPGNWDVLQNCSACVGNWDEGQDCLGCRGHWDPATGCTECLPHWRDAGDDCGGCSSNWDIGQECNACLPGWYGDDCQFWYCEGQAVAEGRFAEPVVYPPNGNLNGHELQAADFNGDGLLDIAVVGTSESGRGQLEMYLGNGAFASDPQRIFSPGSSREISTKAATVAAADLDGDTFLDLAVTDSNLGEVIILLGDGQGGFLDGTGYAACDGAYATVIFDTDGDSVVDIVVTCREEERVVVLRGNGDGTFSFSGSYPVGEKPEGIVADDIDGNGIIDLLVSSGAVDGFWVLWGGGSAGQGDGTFSAPLYYESGGWGRNSLVTGDFNADGATDVVAASHELYVYLNDGGGGLVLTATYHIPISPRSLATVDIDNDGILDLAVGEMYYSSLVLLRGNGQQGTGDGTFTMGERYDLDSVPNTVSSGDFNSDGIVDLLLLTTSDDLVLLLGTGECR